MRETPGALALLPVEVLAGFAHEHLSGLEDVFISPEIPRRKLRVARATHAASLEESETVAVLYDATLFGSADDGFVATPARLCWKNYLALPRSIRWEELNDSPFVLRGGKVELGSAPFTAPMVARTAERLHRFLEACRGHTSKGPSPYRDPGRLRTLPSMSDQMLAAVRRNLGEVEWVHYAPSIPPKMARAARIVHERHLEPSEPILVLYDDTVLRSGSDGFVLTERHLHIRNFWGTAEAIAWEQIDPERVLVEGDQIFLDSKPGRPERSHIDLRMRPGKTALVASALRAIARLARAARETAARR